MPATSSFLNAQLTTHHLPKPALRFALLILILAAFTLSAPAQETPTVTVSPDSGRVESARFTIQIEGLQPNALYSVEFLFDGEVVFSSEESSDDGGFITFPAGSTAGDLPGRYTVQVVQDGQALASADFALTAQDTINERTAEVTVRPAAGAIGSLHEIEITGLEALKRYTLEITAAETQQVAYRRARTSDRAGNIALEIFAEAGDSPGPQAIAVYDADGETVAQGGFTIDAPAERDLAVIVEPSIIAAASAVEISVSGLAAFDSVSALVKSAEGLLIDSVVARATKDGEVTMTFTGPDDMAKGLYDIEIFAEGDKVATATLTIAEAAGSALDVAAALSVSPTSAAIGSEHLIGASGLQPGFDYQLRILDPNGAEEYATARAADDAGAFMLRLSSTPEDDLGAYTVEIRDAADEVLLASAMLEITSAAEEMPEDAIATIDPQSAPIGSSHLISLSNLRPGEQVEFDVSFAGETVYQSGKTADAAGMVRLELVTDAGDSPGDYLITAGRASGNQPTVVLTATAAEAPDPAIAASMRRGELIEGRLAESRAEIEFEGEQGQYLRITVRSDDFDPAAALFDRDDLEIAFNGDSRGRKSAVIGPLPMPYSGSYILEVFPSPLLAQPAKSAGDFLVSIEAVGVASVDAANALSFSLNPASPAAYFELPAMAGDKLTLAVESADNLDTTLQVLSSAGVELAFDDDSGSGLAAEISNLIVDRDGSYLLAVSTFDQLETGSGRIRLSRNPPRQLEDGEVIVSLSDKAIRDLLSFRAEAEELLTLHLDKLTGDVEDLFVTATVDGMQVMSYSTMGVPDQLPLPFIMPMSGQALVTLEKFGVDDGISLAVSLERQ